MEKVRKLFLNCSKHIVYGMFTVIALYLFLLSLFGTCVMAYTDEHVFFIKDFPILMLMGLGILMTVMVWAQGMVGQRYSGKREAGIVRFLPGVTICWFGILIFWIYKTLLPPMHDQYFVFYGAKEFLEGDYSLWMPGGYLQMYPFQNTLMLFYTVFHLIFKQQAVLAVELFNLFCWYLSILAICHLTENYFGKMAAKWTYIVLLGFMPMWGYVTYIYGTVPGLCCGLWGIVEEGEFENSGKTRHLLGAGVLLALAVMWKNNYIIFAVAVMIMILLYIVREKKWKCFWGIGWILGLYFLGTKGSLALIEMVTGQDMSNGIPLVAWVAMGLRESNIAPGWFNMYTERLYETCDYQGALMVGPALEEIQRNFTLFSQEPAYALRFFSRKLASMWNNPMMESTTIITKRNSMGTLSYAVKDILYNGGVMNTILFLWMDVLQSVLLFGLILYLIFERKKLKIENACFIIVILGGFLFHIFWEGKCQYILPYYVLMFPFGVQGYLITSTYLAGEMEGLKGIGHRMCMLWKEGSVKLLTAVIVMVFVIVLLSGEFIHATVKMNNDTADYVWYCRNELQWKNKDYVRETW